MRTLAAALILLAAPADAHCFSQWRYPYPQRCEMGREGGRNIQLARGHKEYERPLPMKSKAIDPAPPKFGPPADLPDIPVILPAPVDEDDSRDAAIALLRNKLDPH